MSGKTALLQTLAALGEKLGRSVPEEGTTAELKAMIAEWQAELEEQDVGGDEELREDLAKNVTAGDDIANAGSGLVKFKALATLHINARDERGQMMTYVLKDKTGYTDAGTLQELIAGKLAQRLH